MSLDREGNAYKFKINLNKVISEKNKSNELRDTR